MPKTYQPGQRQKRYGVNHHMSEDKVAWVTLESGKFIIIVGDESKAETGHDVLIFHPRPGWIPDTAINLTNLTEQELDELLKLFNTAFEWARPVVQRRDKEALDAAEQGDDSYSRYYRAVPTVVYRKRPSDEYDSGVRSGPEGISEGDGDRGSQLAGVRGSGDELVESHQEASRSEDDSTETN